MKSLCMNILALCCIVSGSGYAHEAKQTHCKSACVDCKHVHAITQKHFNNGGKHSKTLVIKKPGNYCLSETIHWCPKSRNRTAIIIDASNVTLDLSGHQLRQVNDQGRCSGILVTTGHDTVKIVNGAVRDFTQLGIVVEGGTSNIFLGNDDTNLKVTGCGYGSSFSFFDDVDEEPILQGGIQLGQTQALAAQGYYTWQGNIDTANLINVFAEENGPVGMYLGTGSDIISQNCYFCRNTEERMAGIPNAIATETDETRHFVFGVLHSANIGFGDEGSNTIQFLKCHFDNNLLTAGPSQGAAGLLMAFDVNNLLISKCTFNSNSAFGGEEGSVVGCDLGGNIGTVIEESHFDNNFSEFSTEGLHQSGRNRIFDSITTPEGFTIRQCTANGNQASGSGIFPIAVGFDLLFIDGFTIEDCTALNNTALSTDTAAFGFANGLVLSGSGSPLVEEMNGLVRSCHFAGNKTNFAGGDVEGIFIGDPASRIVIQDCVIQDNTGSDFNSGIWIANFGSGGEFSSMVIENCVIEGQTLGIYSNGDNNSIYQNNTITDVDYGVLLDGSSCDSINNNYVTNAVNGFVDTANPSTSLFSNNKVFGAVTPYDVTYTFGPVPVRSGSLVTGFPTGAEVLDNVFMDNPTCTQAPPLAAATGTMAKKTFQSKAKKALQARQKRLKF